IKSGKNSINVPLFSNTCPAGAAHKYETYPIRVPVKRDTITEATPGKKVTSKNISITSQVMYTPLKSFISNRKVNVVGKTNVTVAYQYNGFHLFSDSGTRS